MDLTKYKYIFKVTWSPYLLRPEMPLEGIPHPEGYGPDNPRSRQLIRIGLQVGIDFTYKSRKFPNTVKGHCALEYALDKDPSGVIQTQLQEKLFESYFTNGEDLDSDVIARVASECNLPSAEVKTYIEDPQNQAIIKEKAIKNRNERANGVPFYIINHRKTVSGAQDFNTFMKAFEDAAGKYPI